MALDNFLGAGASGAASGAGMGATIGSLIPGVGTAAGAGVGALLGATSGLVKQNRANQAQEIPVVDPFERQRLSRLEQISKNLSAGTDSLTQQNIAQQKNLGRAAQNAVSKVTGGDVGGTLDALLRTQRGTQSGVNQAVAQAAQRLPYFDSAAGNLASRIGQRRLELGLLNRSQALAENAQARTDANVNTQALLATQGGLGTIPQGLQAVPQGFQNTMNIIKNLRLKNQSATPETNEIVAPTVTSTDQLNNQPVNQPVNEFSIPSISGINISPQGFVNVQQSPSLQNQLLPYLNTL